MFVLLFIHSNLYVCNVCAKFIELCTYQTFIVWKNQKCKILLNIFLQWFENNLKTKSPSTYYFCIPNQIETEWKEKINDMKKLWKLEEKKKKQTGISDANLRESKTIQNKI